VITDTRLQQIRFVCGSIAMLAAVALLVKPELGSGFTGKALGILFIVAGIPAALATMLVVKPFWERFR
jgi:hypothetical protein